MWEWEGCLPHRWLQGIINQWCDGLAYGWMSRATQVLNCIYLIVVGWPYECCCGNHNSWNSLTLTYIVVFEWGFKWKSCAFYFFYVTKLTERITAWSQSQPFYKKQCELPSFLHPGASIVLLISLNPSFLFLRSCLHPPIQKPCISNLGGTWAKCE